MLEISQISPRSDIIEQQRNMHQLDTSTSTSLKMVTIESSLVQSQTDEHKTDALSNRIESESYTSQHERVARSASPILNEIPSKSTIDDEENERNSKIEHLDTNDVEAFDGRYYNIIKPTSTGKTADASAEPAEITKSERMGKDLSIDSFLSKRGPRLDITSGSPFISPTNVIPMSPPIATISNHARQNPNPDIQDIITGIVKLLNGNVNVHANTQQQPSRRPISTRINNRGPPRISEAQPLPNDFVEHQPLQQQMQTSSLRPPPYPFDRPDGGPIRPFINGVPLPEQIVPSMQQNYRPGFVSQNRPPWHRPRPRPPITGSRRPIPPYQPIATMPEYHPEDDVQLTTSEVDTNTSGITAPDSSSGYEVEEDHNDDIEVTSVTSIDESSSATKVPNKKEEFSKKKDSKDKIKSAEKKPIIPVTQTDNFKPTVTTIFQSTSEINTSQYIASTITEKEATTSTPSPSSMSTLTSFIIESSIADEDSLTSSSSLASTTYLTSSTLEHHNTPKHSSYDLNQQIQPTATVIPTSSQPIDSSFPYHPRPGIVLDDPEFKPGGANRGPPRPRPQLSTPIIPPGYGEIFDVTLSAIQGPSGSGSLQTIKLKPYGENYGGSGNGGDIIVSPSGDEGFVSIDGKRTYLNLFGDSSETSTSIAITKTHITAAPHTNTAVKPSQIVSFKN